MADAFRSYSWYSSSGHCLIGHVVGDVPEWHFNRLADALEVKSKDHVYLTSNKEKFEAELEAAQVPVTQLHYRGQSDPDEHQSGHTVESRCLLVLLAVMAGRRSLGKDAKPVCALLLQELVRQATETTGARKVDDGRIRFNAQAALPF